MSLKNLKILITRDIPESGLQLLQNEGCLIEMRSSENPFTYQELLLKTKNFDSIISTSKEKIDRNFMDHNRHLKIISQFAAGFDNIDINAATEFGIAIGHTPHVLNNATSDIAFGLMIAVSRKFFFMHKKILNDNWGDFKPQADLGLELNGKTLGVFGLGAIGFELARKCKAAFGMSIIYCNRNQNSKAETELGAKKVSFDDLLNQSDVLSVHADLNESTKGVFDRSAFKKMKSNAIFINTSRGKLVNELDLHQALIENQIWGAGLDVTDPEPMAFDNPLLEMPNVCILPHIGSATTTARSEMSRLAAENIIEFHKNNRLICCANPGFAKN